jgi:DNA-binding beta-propeller fold protein YncE
MLFLAGCKDEHLHPPIVIDQTNNGFENYNVASIIVNNCATAGCHAGNHPPHGFDLSTHANLMRGSSDRGSNDHQHKKLNSATRYGGEAVIPFRADKSLLYNLITGNIIDSSQKMPYHLSPLNESDIEVLRSWIDNGAKDNLGRVPFSNVNNNIYAAQQGSDEVYIIDPEYLVVSRILNVDVSPAIVESPHNIQIHGNYYYVTLIATGELLKVDKGTNTIIGRVGGIERAGMIQVTKDGSTAFISRSSTSPGIYDRIYAVNLNTMTIKGELILPVTGVPHAITLNNSNDLLYVANLSKDRISIFNTGTFELVDDIALSTGSSAVHEPMHTYISPDDKYLYINCRRSSKMLVMDTDNYQIIKELVIKNHPMQSAVSADGSKIYTVSHHEPYITEITKTGTDWVITREYRNDYFHHLYGADLSPDGRYLYATVSNSDPVHIFKPTYQIPGKTSPSLLAIYDTLLGEVIKVIDIGSYSTGVAARQN